MTEERTQYATDEVTQLRRQVAQLVDRLDAAFKTIDGFTDASNFQWAQYQARIKEYEATVERLEADNRRLRKLDSMPLDAMRRYYRGTVYTPAAAQRYDYMPDDYDVDSADIFHWLFPQDGDA